MFVLILWTVEQRILHSGGSRPLDNGRGASVWSKNRGGGGADPFPRSASVTFGACCSSLLSGVDPGGGGEGGLGG